MLSHARRARERLKAKLTHLSHRRLFLRAFLFVADLALHKKAAIGTSIPGSGSRTLRRETRSRHLSGTPMIAGAS
jgi:hypothetical protein